MIELKEDKKIYKLELHDFGSINYRVYYRGLKNITAVVSDDGDGNVITFSNKDVIKVDGSDIFLNGKLISNDPTLTSSELEELYKFHLKEKGYKFV